MRTGPLAEQVKVIAARLAGVVSELRQNAFFDPLREHLLRQLLRNRRQPVIVVDTPIILPEGHTLRSKVGTSGRLEQVVRVELVAQLHATAARGKERSMAVLGQRPETKPSTVSAQRRLGPLLVVWVETRELLKGPPNMVVEGSKSIGMERRRDGSDGENHFTEAGAVAKELQGDLGVRQLTESLQNAACLSDAGLGVLVAELLVTHRPAKQLKVALPDHLEVARELANVNRGSLAADQDELALVLEVGLASAEPEAELRAPSLQGGKSRRNSGGFTSQAEVVQVGIDKLEPTAGTRASQLRQHRLQDQREQQRAERVALLNTTLRRDDVVAKHQIGVNSVAEVDPRREARETVANLAEEAGAVDSVERVLEVKFKEDLVRTVAIAQTPLPSGLQPHFSAERHRHADLERA